MKRLWRRSLAALAVLLLLFAGLTLVARALLPQASGLRAEVASALGDALGVDVEVGAFAVRLRGLSPELAFDDARLYARHPGVEAEPGSAERDADFLLGVKELRVDFDLIASLLAWQPRIDAVTLSGAEVRFRRETDGRIVILGLDAMAGGGDGAALDFFLREGRFRLVDSTLYWEDAFAGVPNLALVVDRLELVNRGQRHRIAGRGRPPGDPAGRLDLAADLRGPPQDPADWSGRLYLGWHGDDLARVVGGRLPAGWGMSSGSLALQSWNRLDRGRLVESLNRIALDDLVLDRGAEAARVALGNVGTLARWRAEADGWLLELADLRLPDPMAGGPAGVPGDGSAGAGRGGSEATTPSGTGRDAGGGSQGPAGEPTTAPALARRVAASKAPVGASTSARLRLRQVGAADAAADAGEETARAEVHAAVGRLEIAAMARLLALLSDDLPAPLTALLQRRPSGRVEAIGLVADLAMPAATGAVPRLGAWRLSGRGTNLALPRADKSPGIEGLDVRFVVTPQAGRASIDARALVVDLRPFFAAPHRYARLTGRIGWQLTGNGGLWLWTPDLSGETADLKLSADLAVRSGGDLKSPLVDLRAFLRDGRIEALGRWLPTARMDPRLVDWLTRAIVAGQIESGVLLFHGPLASFPFDDGSGLFLLTLQADDGVLDYNVRPNQALAPGPDKPNRNAGQAPDGDDRSPDAAATLADAGAAGPTKGRADAKADEGSDLRWPLVRDIRARLVFENRKMTIDFASARYLNSQVEGGEALLPNVFKPAQLKLDVRGEGPLTDGLHVLETTPLSRQLGTLARAARVTGCGGVDLGFEIPLGKGLDFGYRGQLRFGDAYLDCAQPEPETDGAVAKRTAGRADGPGARAADHAALPTLNLVDVGMQFDAIEGELDFDNAGVRAEGIRARFGEQALDVDVKTLAGGKRTEVDLRGRSTVAFLKQRLKNPWWRIADGALAWRFSVGLDNSTVNESKPPLALRLSSDLKGLALSLPAPLGKSAGVARELDVSARWESRWPLRSTLRVGAMGALLSLERPAGAAGSAPRLGRIAIGLDGVPDALPATRIIAISGAVDRFALQPWLDWVGGAGKPLLDAPGRSGGDRGSRLPVEADVSIGTLTFGAFALTGVTARLAMPGGDGWTVDLDSAETGTATLSRSGASGRGAFSARLARLDLAPFVVAAEDAPKADAPRRTDPRGLPGFDLAIGRLGYGAAELGALQLRLTPTPDGLALEDGTIVGEGLSLKATGHWRSDQTDYVDSDLSLSAHSDDLGGLLQRTGLYSGLAGAPADLSATLSWPGGPGELSLKRARGELAAKLGPGRLLRMEPGVGRLLGILNLGALHRRLSLDFSDVFDEGFGFDAIDADIALGSGLARIDNFEILSAPADIRITGTANLVAGTLDQRVAVTPKIGTGVALASAVAGGPVVGAAVLLADKATGGGVDRLARYSYQVTGPWGDPTIARIANRGGVSVGDLFVDDDAAARERRSGEPTGAAGAATAGGRRADDAANRRPTSLDSPFMEGF